MQYQTGPSTTLRKCACGQYLIPDMIPRPGPSLEASLALWLDVGNLEPLEQALLAGYGFMMEGRASRLPRVAAFLRKLPIYQGRIAQVHEAASEGRITELARLLDHEGHVWATSRDMVAGTTPIQKAMLGRHFAAVRLLMRRAPCCLQATDRMGRAPLHYAAALDAASGTGDGKWYHMLLEAGAEKDIQDSLGRTPEFYLERCSEILEQRRVSPVESPEQRPERRPPEDDILIFHVTVEIRQEDVDARKLDERPPARAA